MYYERSGKEKTRGASGSGVGLSQAQAVGMGLQLSQIKAQTNLMNAEFVAYLALGLYRVSSQ